MANLTPVATPAGGFPLVLRTQKPGGATVSVTFPNSSAVNPGDAAAEYEFKQMRAALAAGGHTAAVT